jgi:hypothetical protein
MHHLMSSHRDMHCEGHPMSNVETAEHSAKDSADQQLWANSDRFDD